MTDADPSSVPDEDLWFLPGPPEPAFDPTPPGPRAEPNEASVLDEWRAAEAGQAARLARVALRLGQLDERLRQGPPGWRQRLALAEAVDLGWHAGYRIAPDRLALWIVLRVGNTEAEDQGYAKLGWAVRRLTGGPGPMADLATFLGRHVIGGGEEAPLSERIAGLLEMLHAGRDLHPLTRACLCFHLWPLAGIGPEGERLEAAVTAARLAAADCAAAAFVPLATAGSAALRAGGLPPVRLGRWLDGMEAGLAATLRGLEDLTAWQTRAQAEIADLSGQTPGRLIEALIGWPLLSASMAEALTGKSRAAVQRNLTLFQARGLVREVTGQGRFRFWKAVG
ncbi:MAG: hypothetical protein KGI94_13900 [Paracoccaceae bacterium]|nr:hypothetical protein [Paracoccaceae bacterium]